MSSTGEWIDILWCIYTIHTMKTNNCYRQWHALISRLWVEKKKKVHAIRFYLYEVQEQARLSTVIDMVRKACLLWDGGGKLPKRIETVYIFVSAIVTWEYTYFLKFIKLYLNPVHMIASYTYFKKKRERER